MMDDDRQPAGGVPEQTGQDHRYLGMADAEAWEVKVDELGILKIQEEAVRRGREDSFTTSESSLMEYKSRPLGQVLGCGTLGLVLLSARFWLFPINAGLGEPLGQGLGAVTLLLMFAGAFCVFMAWPKYQPRGMTDEEYQRQVSQREEFRRRHGR